MYTLILIRDLYIYIVACTVVCGLGCSNIASLIYFRWFIEQNINPLTIHFWVKLVIVLLSLLVIPIPQLFHLKISNTLIGMLLGLYLGFALTLLEVRINRYIIRNKKNLNVVFAKHRKILTTIEDVPINLLMMRSVRVSNRLKKLHQIVAVKETYFGELRYQWLISNGVLEEIIFRGNIVYVCKMLPNYWSVIMLLASTIFFGATHAHINLIQFLLKTLMGMVCLLLTVMFDSVIPAIVLHTFINAAASRYNVKN